MLPAYIVLKADFIQKTTVHPCFQIVLKEGTFFVLVCMLGTLRLMVSGPNISIHISTLLSFPCNLSWLRTKSVTIKRIINGLCHWGV